MDIRPRQLLSDRAADLLLDARSSQVAHGHSLLAGVLAAAAAPGRSGEWSSEQACLVAFRAAQLVTVAGSGRVSIVRMTMLRMLTVKAAFVALAAAGGGLALAAGTGIVGNPFESPPVPGTPDGSGLYSPARQAPSWPPGGEPGPSRSVAGETGAPATDPPSLPALCRAYGAGNKTERGKALDSPAFRVLITAAGGRSTVGQFCQNVLAAPDASHTGDSTPSGRVHPTGPPTDPAGDHRTGKPTSHPGH